MKFTVILDEMDQRRLSKIGESYPLVRRHRLLQEAARLGLRVLAQNPTRLLEEARVENRSPGSTRD